MNGPKDHLQLIAGMMPTQVPLAMEFALSHGLELLPKAHKYKRGKLGECFKNATLGAYEHGLLYCEGWASSGELSGICLEHAWCVDPDDLSVIDLTWNYSDAEYFGVILDLREVAKITIENHVYGVLGNLYRKRWPVQSVREWLPSIVYQREKVN